MKKFTKILLIISPIILVLSALKGFATIVLLPLAIILSAIFVALNVLVRKLQAAYPHNPPWIYIAFWWVIFSFWGIFLLVQALWDNGTQWVFFLIPLSKDVEAFVGPTLSWLDSIAWLLLPCAIIFFVIVVITYSISTRSQKTKSV